MSYTIRDRVKNNCSICAKRNECWRRNEAIPSNYGCEVGFKLADEFKKEDK